MYKPELRRFVFTLHYYSPRAYNYLRQKLNDCLPHPKTISKWYVSVHGEPGINNESIRIIKQHVENSSYTIIGALMFDEIAIKHEKPKYVAQTLHGYVDYGEDIENDSETSLAT